MKVDLDLLREWVRAEIEAIVLDRQPGSDGYYGSAYIESKYADKMFKQLKESFDERS